MSMPGSQSTILAACRYFVRPLARLLLRNGIGYADFAAVCKAAFVDVATQEYGLKGRPANLSRVAILTGISRKEVARLRGRRADGHPDASRGLNPASMVLRGWYSDPAFVDAAGVPRPLAAAGPPPNLVTLVKRHAGDLPVGAVIGELKRTGVIEAAGPGLLRPVGRQFIPPLVDGQLFASGATSLHNLATTLAHNTSVRARPLRYFERYAWSNHLPRAAVRAFHRLVAERGSVMLESIDEWLREHEQPPKGRVRPQASEVGVGIYFFDTEPARRGMRKKKDGARSKRAG